MRCSTRATFAETSAASDAGRLAAAAGTVFLINNLNYLCSQLKVREQVAISLTSSG
jgi:hypothetical protein